MDRTSRRTRQSTFETNHSDTLGKRAIARGGALGRTAQSARTIWTSER
jgi:hypothetical protein